MALMVLLMSMTAMSIDIMLPALPETAPRLAHPIPLELPLVVTVFSWSEWRSGSLLGARLPIASVAAGRSYSASRALPARNHRGGDDPKFFAAERGRLGMADILLIVCTHRIMRSRVSKGERTQRLDVEEVSNSVRRVARGSAGLSHGSCGCLLGHARVTGA